MSDLIDRDETINEIHKLAEQSSCRATDQIDHMTIRIWNKAILNAEAVIREQTKADTEKHAHWIEDEYCGYYACSNCDGIGTANGMSPIEDCHLNYCPYCGAKMDEVADKK